jgi:hypothetical protein
MSDEAVFVVMDTGGAGYSGHSYVVKNGVVTAVELRTRAHDLGVPIRYLPVAVECVEQPPSSALVQANAKIERLEADARGKQMAWDALAAGYRATIREQRAEIDRLTANAAAMSGGGLRINSGATAPAPNPASNPAPACEGFGKNDLPVGTTPGEPSKAKPPLPAHALSGRRTKPGIFCP